MTAAFVEDRDDIVISADGDAAGAVELPVEKSQVCEYTTAAMIARGVTHNGACPTIYSQRSRRCPCGQLGANGKYRAWKNCCGKGK